MTQLELDAIRDRLTKVTPGPWGTIPPGGPNGHFWGICNRMGNIVAMRLTDRQGDATFIAYARDDVPALLTEVERLRVENAELLQHWLETANELADMLPKLEAMRLLQSVGRPS